MRTNYVREAHRWLAAPHDLLDTEAMRWLLMNSPNVQQTARGPRLLDPVRKQLVPDGPEERVRQSVLWSLVHEYGYPAAALASEELVARGTANRDRADVLIRLPRTAAARTFRVTTAEGAAREEPAYSRKVASVDALIGGFPPGYSPQLIDDEITIDIDGERVRCRTLGFTTTGEGHGLALLPIEPPRGIPPVIGILVSGYGRVDKEIEIAQRLGIPLNEWKYDASTELAEALCVGAESLRSAVEASALSSDGRRGAMLLYGDAADAFGVLVNVDLDADQASAEAPEPHHATEASEDSAAVAWGDAELATLAVVECKADAVELTADVIAQAERYASRLGAPFLVVTNRRKTRVFKRGLAGVHEEVEDLPSYADVVSGNYNVVAISPEPPPPRLPSDVAGRPDCLRLHRRFRSETVALATAARLWMPILALDDALRADMRLSGVPFERHGIRIVEDLGLNVREPGSPVGASWPGEYRDLLVEDASGHRIVLGLAVLGSWKVVDKARASGHWARGGDTYLIASTSDGAEYECTLQFDLEKGLVDSGAGWELHHDGALTAGKGSVKRDTLFDALRARAPFLVRGRSVALGGFLHGPTIDFPAVQDVLARFAAYALVRRDVKRQVKAARAAGRA